MKLHKCRQSCNPRLPGIRALRKSHSSQKNSSRCKKGGSFILCAAFIHEEKLSLASLFGTRGLPDFILWSCFFLSALWVGVSFSDVEGKRWVFSITHDQASPLPPAEKSPGNLLGGRVGVRSESWAAALVASIPELSGWERRRTWRWQAAEHGV